jgi:hypothetical protein
MTFLEKMSTDIFLTNITQMTLRVFAAIHGLKKIRLAVFGDLSRISETGEVLSDDSKVQVEITYFNEAGANFYHKAYQDFHAHQYDCVFIITDNQHREQNILTQLKLSKSNSTSPVVIAWNSYLNAIIATLGSFESLPTCLNYTKIFAISSAIFLSRPQGVILECGVYFGGTTAFMGRLQKAFGINRQILAFDTFTGLPAPTSKDIEAGGSIYTEGFFNETSLQKVERLLSNSNLSNDVKLIQGLVQDTLPSALGSNFAAFAFLDMDQYEGTYQALKTLLLAQPAYLIAIIDDTSIPGVDQAIQDACKGYPVLRTNICHNFDLLSLESN